MICYNDMLHADHDSPMTGTLLRNARAGMLGMAVWWKC
jgi:hypothetical protein